MPKLAYLDCACGISGDMTLGALVDAGVNIEALNSVIGSLGLPDCRLVAEEVKRQGFRATKVNVIYAPEHEHRHLHHILAMIDAGRLSARQKDTARRIFTRLAEAEAKVHGVAIDKIHFHEVGAADAIADVVGAVVGFDLLGVERIVASPVPTGWGTITMAHGECSIPAPATAELLQGIPLAESSIQGELTTPTGAAILSVLADGFRPDAVDDSSADRLRGGQQRLARPAQISCELCWANRSRTAPMPRPSRFVSWKPISTTSAAN